MTPISNNKEGREREGEGGSLSKVKVTIAVMVDGRMDERREGERRGRESGLEF